MGFLDIFFMVFLGFDFGLFVFFVGRFIFLESFCFLIWGFNLLGVLNFVFRGVEREVWFFFFSFWDIVELVVGFGDIWGELFLLGGGSISLEFVFLFIGEVWGERWVGVGVWFEIR